MKIELKPMAMNIEGSGTVVRIKSGGMIVLILFLTLVVVGFNSYLQFNETSADNDTPTGSKSVAAKGQLKKNGRTP